MLGFGALGEFALGEGPTSTAAPAQTLSGGNEWPDFVKKAGLTAAVIATTFGGFVAPPQARAATFTKFSEPLRKPNIALHAAWKFNPTVQRTQTAIFAQFSQPQISRVNLPDEQPSALFEVLPPQVAPFAGFARFIEYLPKKSVIFLYSAFPPTPVLIPVIDTHDGVWVKKKRRHGRDPLELELEERSKRRAAIELAVYGPEVTYEAPPATIFAPPAPPPNVEELARAIMAAKQMLEQQQRAALEQDDEDVLEMILRDL